MEGQGKTAVLIGAGPAGLTAALELLRRTDIRPIVLEKTGHIGGLSRTVNHKGNRIDIGGHRFFSKSDRVMNWWLEMMPPEPGAAATEYITYQQKSRAIQTTAYKAENRDCVMLIRNRRSRIYFLRKFFDYPIKLSPGTLRNLGPARTLKIGASYAASVVRQIRPEKTLEDFLINRFGRQLYLTFFKSYTEKVWGIPCHQINAEWGAQRIKGLSITKALAHAAFRSLRRGDVRQKQVETSLIEKFLYPKFGPGQLWEHVAGQVIEKGGSVHTGWSVDRIETDGQRVTAVHALHDSGERRQFPAEYVFSTMPIKELIRALEHDVPASVREIADGLVYRDFITVGLLLKKLRIREQTGDERNRLLKDTWIYIQEPDVLVGRMQIFNNWSPFLVADPDTVWIGLEYFCYENDELWNKPDSDMIGLAKEEMERIGVISPDDVLDAVVLRVPKTYPAYFGTYHRFSELREYVDQFENLFLVGRNGMHRYNNQDHSMLTAMTAVDNIVAGRLDKSNIWSVNTEQEYHESRSGDSEDGITDTANE